MTTMLYGAQVGHNIYILCHQLSKHSDELHRLLHSTDLTTASDKLQRALHHYGHNTAQIEVSCSMRYSTVAVLLKRDSIRILSKKGRVRLRKLCCTSCVVRRIYLYINGKNVVVICFLFRGIYDESTCK